MKFKYNIKKNYYNMYGEANYLAANKKKYLNSSKNNIKNIYKEYIKDNIIAVILLIITLFLNNLFLISITVILNITYLINLFYMLNAYFIYKNSNHKGEIIIDEKGITDISDISITFSWEKIEIIGVTKNSLIIITDSPLMLILEPNEKIIKEMLKYKEIKIIRD